MINRREFLWSSTTAACAAAARARQDDPQAKTKPVLMTVNGPVAPSRIGTMLCHEHVMVDFIGADRATPDRYNRDEVERLVLPHLKTIKQLGCTCVAECTPAHLGRDPLLLKRLSAASGLHILTNTGYYAANGGKHLPEHFSRETADEAAQRWLDEWNNGIGDTGVRPGFIKIGVDSGPLNAAAKRLIRAAARVHKQTGLTIASHTGDSVAAAGQLELLVAEEVDPSAWIWVHAQNEVDSQVHINAAALGAWIEFDGIAPNTIDQHVLLVDTMRRANLINRILISHDAGWYHVGEPGGGTFRPYDTLFNQFLPALKKRGFDDVEITALLADNPSNAFRVERRTAE
jgi:phosphotriesterase-related protein